LAYQCDAHVPCFDQGVDRLPDAGLEVEVDADKAVGVVGNADEDGGARDLSREFCTVVVCGDVEDDDSVGEGTVG